jgi:hypothetical protein
MATEVLPLIQIFHAPEGLQEQISGLEGSIAPNVLEALDEDRIAQLNGKVSQEEIGQYVSRMPIELQRSWNRYVQEAARLLWLRRDQGMLTTGQETERNFIDAQRTLFDIYHNGKGSGSK